MKTSAFDPAGAATIVDVLRYRAAHQPDQLAYSFLADGEAINGQWTYFELDQAARAVAASLQRHTRPGDRVLLAYPQGLELLAAYFGCLYSGVIAIPAPLPERRRLRRTLDRLQAIADDAACRYLLTTKHSLALFEEVAETQGGSPFADKLATDSVPRDAAADYRPISLQATSLAYLQYTSGSTTAPRGVMVEHRHLMANSAAIASASPYGPDCRTVTWLPYFHDYGLVEGLLQPVFSGFPCWFFAPLAFVERPLRWLSAISRFRATHSQAPNFAFAMAVAKTTAVERESLDLSSWRAAGNGSEPIHAATAQRFIEAFAPCGFRAESFCPVYGLAEGTLIVSYKRAGRSPSLDRLLPQSGSAIVGCGEVLDNLSVEIVDPVTRRVCAAGGQGEIWVAGPSVAAGYWNRPEETDAVFQARLTDSDSGPFLRTGDLGFLRDRELFVGGRIKDLIIVHGSNYYPQDIEETVERCHPALRAGGTVAFSINVDGEEKLVLVAESKVPPDETTQIASTIREQVALNHDLAVHDLVFISPGELAKTSSGKKQRSLCRRMYFGRAWSLASPDEESRIGALATEHQSNVGNDSPTPNAAEIGNWLCKCLAEIVGLPAAAINVRQSFASYGLVSLGVVELVERLQTWLARPLSPSLLYAFPTPVALAAHLAGDAPVAAAGWEASSAPTESQCEPTSTARRSESTIENRSTQLAEQPIAPRRSVDEPIAIVGMACRLPCANSPAEYWENLCCGKTAIREIPAERWLSQDFYDPHPRQPGKSISKWGGFLDQVDRFDARFFGVSPYEAERMDPQQRLLLEVGWEALEQAGLAGKAVSGSDAGVFVGVILSEYFNRVASDTYLLGGHAATGNFLSITANRLSYFLNLRGPSLAVDTACSSSLVAIHLAAQSLRAGECSLALAGGAQVLLEPEVWIDYSQAGMLAPDGRTKPFDDRANGFARGEGVVLFALKRLSDAIRDGHTIQAVIRATAVNQDGHTNGLTAPNGRAQAELLQKAYQAAGVSPDSVGFIEAHGTGTALGDPIEVEALTTIFGGNRRRQRCALGSVKPNVGHLEPAAGAAGLLKAILSVAHGELPPTLNLSTPSRHLDLEGSPFYLLDRPRAWTHTAGPRRAGVSAFGFGGTNAHVILEQAPLQNSIAREAQPTEHLFVLSARNDASLGKLVDSFRKADLPDDSLADLCFTLQVGRAHFPHRLAIAARTMEELKQRLASVSQNTESLDVSVEGVFQSAIGIAQRANSDSPRQISATELDSTPLTRLLAERYVRGHDNDWSVLHVGHDRRRVPAPTYPFERERFWIKSARADRGAAPNAQATRAVEGANSQGDEAPTAYVERLLRRCVAEALGLAVADVGVTTNIQELGLNSILAKKAAVEVTRQSGVDLDVIEFFLQPTLARLATHLAARPEWQSRRPTPSGVEIVPSSSAAPSTSTVSAPQRMFNQSAELPSSCSGLGGVSIKELAVSQDTMPRSDDIAVIGIACRFPGADSPEAFWDNLIAGRDVVGPLPGGRRRDAGLTGKTETKLPRAWLHGGFLNDVAGFDAALFGLSPHEARRIDPQQRLFLECAWETLERAGYAPARLADPRVGVFAGVAPSDYARLWDRLGRSDDPHFGSGTSLAMIANRTSYLLNLVGPSLAVDTACSASLIAVALACQSLRAGECTMALAGGVNLILIPELSEALAHGGMLSPRGRSCSFDDHADGYVRGEGVGIVLLKPLADAMTNGDQVLAVIKGVGVNHDGHDKPGLTAPSAAAQIKLLEAAYGDAGVDPRSISYLEAHGTGTALGDPIELAALQAVCGEGRLPGTCALGAVKSAIGHLEAAAGIAGLIKTVLAIQHHTLPPSLHCGIPNQRFDWLRGKFYLVDKPRAWSEVQRLAGVSSFGFGGANAHVVIAAAPVVARSRAARAKEPSRSSTGALPAELVAQSPAALLVLSGHTESALRATVKRHLEFLNLPGGPSLAELCFTANCGRAELSHRVAIVARYRDQLADRLRHLQNWDEREHLQGSLVYYGTVRTSTHDSDTDAQVRTRAESWRALRKTLPPDVLVALQGCVSGSLWNVHLRQIADESLNAAQAHHERDDVWREDACVSFWCALGQLFVWGFEINWQRVYAGTSLRRVLAPTYPFERQRFWLDGMTRNGTVLALSDQEARPSNDQVAKEPVTPFEMLVQDSPATDTPRIGEHAELTNQLIGLLADALEAEATSIDPRRPVVELGIDSILAVGLARRLSAALGHTLSPTILYEAGSIAGLTDRLRGQFVDAAVRIAASRRGDAAANFSSKEQPALAIADKSQISNGRRTPPHRGTERRKSGQIEQQSEEPIAVVGVGVRVPGANSLDELWSLVRSGRDLVAPVSSERWTLLAANREELSDRAEARRYSAALLTDIACFDPQFFRLSPREAEEMDPQQRLLLETAWEALESAGYAGGTLAGTTAGVFVGGMASEYLPRLLAMPARLGAYAATGNTLSILANRISYLLNLHGPCLALDTACSSSLVALRLAISSLHRGDCEMALVAGAQVGLAPLHFRLMQQFGGLSPQGRCGPFAQGADGYALGEGVGVVVLKPLDLALADRDHILAVIRGAAINHGGQAAGLTVPNPKAQAAVIQAALRAAGLSAEAISLLEAHGTGTALGDPLEIAGLLQAYHANTAKSQFCAIGSIKANLGHLEPAAGILGLIKLIAALNARELPPTLHFDEPNRAISFEGTPFYVADRARPWHSPSGVPRRAGLSSFGYGGANAHVIVEESPDTSVDIDWLSGAPDQATNLLLLSARSSAALRELARRFADYLEASSEHWRDICWTAAVGRPHWPVRLAVAAANPQMAARQLRDCVESEVLSIRSRTSPSDVVKRAVRFSPMEHGEGTSRRLALQQVLLTKTGDERRLFARVCPTFSIAAPLQGDTAYDEVGESAVGPAMQSPSAWESLCGPLAEAYALGHDLLAENMFAAAVSKRVPLPTYPFERQRIWRDLLTTAEEASPVQVAEHRSVHKSDSPNQRDTGLFPWLHTVQWKLSPVKQKRPLAQGLWLVFDDEAALGAELASRLQAAGSRVIRVYPRELDGQVRWHSQTEASAYIDPTSPTSLAQLIRIIAENREPLSGVIHLWSQHRTIVEAALPMGELLREMTTCAGWQLAVVGSLRLLQAMAAADAAAAAGIWFVTRAAQVPGAAHRAEPASAALWGMVRAAERERGDLKMRLRDLAGSSVAQDVSQLIDDLGEASPPFECAWRDNERLVPGVSRYVPANSNRPRPALLDPSDVYVISGGLGAIGLAVAKSFVECGARRLVLVSRRGLSGTNGESASAVARLRAQGATVWTPGVDVCDRESVEQLLAQAREQLGPVRGVVHAAGVLVDRLLPNVDPDDLQCVLAPKLLGAANLLGATAADSLGFFVAVSSLAALVGNAGQIAYSAASSYLDAWLERARSHFTPTPICVIDFGPWGESGMAVRVAGVDAQVFDSLNRLSPHYPHTRSAVIDFWRERGLETISTEIGCLALSLAATEKLPQLAVFGESTHVHTVQTMSDRAFRQLCDIARGPGRAARWGATVPNEMVETQHTENAGVRQWLEQLIVGAVATALRLPPSAVERQREFREHGLDSLMSDEVVRRLRVVLEMPELRVSDLFAHPSVERLAVWFVAIHREHLNGVYSRQAKRLLQPAYATSSAQPTTQAANVIGDDQPGFLTSRESPSGAATGSASRDIAIIGFACRFPGANDAEEFASLVREGRSVVAPMPADRWQAARQFDAHYAAEFEHELPRGGFLSDVDRFDPEFFRISPNEASQMDPRQRLFLEVAYHAAEQSGYGGQALYDAKCGVFVGTGGEDYYTGVAGRLLREHAAPGGTAAALPARLAYFLNLRGPALAIDTACSSSLVALHQAVESLRRRECTHAFVGGVHLHLRLYSYLTLRRMGALSPSGVCRPFDRQADGFVPGEGVAVVLLRPLPDAIAAGDTVYGVIRGSAINNDGRSNGLLAPNPHAQVELLKAAWADGGIDPATISYFEAHGTGTPLGDPMEWSAIQEALRDATTRRQFAVVGSVKSNIGHADAAAGLAGVIKVLLGFGHGALSATCGLLEPNPRFTPEDSPLTLLDRARPWQPRNSRGESLPRRAGVSSFGFAGTNAHVIVEEPPAPSRTPLAASEHALTLSALDKVTLRRLAKAYAQHLRENSELEVLDICRTANTGRAHLTERLAIVATTTAEFIQALDAYSSDISPNNATASLNQVAAPQSACFVGSCTLRMGEHRHALDGLLSKIDSSDLRRLRSACRGAVADEALTTGTSHRGEVSGILHSSHAMRRVAAILYARGAVVDWSQLEDYQSARLVALPLYPYRDERYWLPLASSEPETRDQDVARPRIATSAPELAAHAVEVLLTVPAWKQFDLAEAVGKLTGRWLLAGTRSALARQLVDRMQASGSNVINLTTDHVTNSKLPERQAAENAPANDVVDKTLASRIGNDGGLTGIVYLGLADRCAARDRATSSSDQFVDATQQAWKLVQLIQAIQSENIQDTIQLWIVTAGAQAVTGGEDCVDPANAALWGLARVVPRECPQLRTRAVDVCAEEAWLQPDVVAAGLVREFSRSTTAVEIAHRNSRRFVLAGEPASAYKCSAPDMIRNHGTYLITGGLGGIGLALAHWLAERYQASSVLLSRTSVPPRHTWSELLADDRTELHLCAILRALTDIESIGGQVLVVSGDIGDAATLLHAEQMARTEFGKINGVFHAAGIVRKRPLRDITARSWVDSLWGKLRGGQVLIEWSPREKLDFVAFFSSLAGVDGNVFQAEYSAANRALDALAASARAEGLPVQSIAWDLWHGTGMGRDMAELANERGQSGLDSQVALTVLERTLTLDYAAITVRASADGRGNVSEKTHFAEVDGKLDSTHQAKAERRTHVRQALRDAVAQILGLSPERIQAQQSLPDLGLDSLLAVQLMRQLSRATGEPLPATLPFDFASLELLAEHLESVLPAAAIAAWLGRETWPQPRSANWHYRAPADERVLNLQSGRRVKLLASRGLAWPG
ncbi:MAG: SDR family NAD(P)-dependent oxidoreductase [Pirellulales bacterium]|nr:SDR family NAD(P)-dependent oxidoreductase [Pirellulales bacterium]